MISHYNVAAKTPNAGTTTLRLEKFGYCFPEGIKLCLNVVFYEMPIYSRTCSVK